MSVWRAAVIACGRISTAHGRAYASLPDVELVACADISPEALARFGETFDIAEEHRYLDYRQMLAAERPDLVSVCSLHHQHAEMTIEAARYAPRGILCEKPIAVSLGEADAMIATCRAAGTALIVGHQRRCTAQYAAAHDALREGAIGRLVSIESHGHPYSSLMVDGTHTLDLLRWYAQEAPISWVLAQIDTSEARTGWGTRVENAALLTIGFEDGLRALHTNGGAPMGADRAVLWPPVTPENYHHIILRGTEGEIHIDGDRPREGIPLVRLVRNGQVSEIPLDWYAHPEVHEAVHARIVRDLIQSIETGARHMLDASSARATLEVLIAAYESSRRRALVPLPLENPGNPLFEMLDAAASPGEGADAAKERDET
jgi:predicted dehydrogenase